MDESSLRLLNGDDDEDAALERALALSMNEAGGGHGGAVEAAGNAAGRDAGDASDTESTASVASTASTASTASKPDGGAQSGSNSRQEDDATLAHRDSGRSRANEGGAPQPTTQPGGDVGPAEARREASGGGGQDGGDAVPVQPAVPLLSLDRRAMEAERLARRQRQLQAQQKGQTQGQQLQRPQETPQAKPLPQKTALEMRPAAQAAEPKEVTLQSRPRQQPPKRKADESNVVVIDDDDEDDDDDGEVRVREPPARKQRLETVDDTRPSPRLRQPVTGSSRTQPVLIRDAAPDNNNSRTAAHPNARAPVYPHGVVKKTWVRGHPRLGDDITIEEIWQKQDLELAVLSSFQWDEEWMLERLDLRKTRVLLVAYAPDEAQKTQMRANVPAKVIRFCFPPMQPAGYMHSKLQLLRFPTFLRIVVPTGNLVPYDWGETGGIENMVFLIDLPLVDAQNPSAGQTASTPFLEDLCCFLAAQQVEPSLVQSLRRFDFAETARYAFVCSMSGPQPSSAWDRMGYAGLGRAVRSMGWATSNPIEVDYLSASIGAVNDGLLTALYHACQGDNGSKEYEQRTSKPRKGKGEAAASPSGTGSAARVRNSFRIYFPSEETVSGSWGGKNGAGTICFRSKWWSAPTFPQEVMRDSENVRQGVLLHTKLMLVRRPTPTGYDDAVPGWAYVGSANMSESAWGKATKDKATGQMKMSCRNWECGVLVPVDADVQVLPSLPASSSAQKGKSRDPSVVPSHSALGGQEGAGQEGTKMLDMFRGTVPIPISVPGTKYVGHALKPWFFLES